MANMFGFGEIIRRCDKWSTTRVVEKSLRSKCGFISSSELLIPLSATIIWACRFNLLHTAITFDHFFTVSLWAQNLPPP